MITIEYLAGFFDGEGCITVVGSKPPSVNLIVSIAQTELQILTEIRECFGGYLYPKVRRSAKHNQAWELRWVSRSAIEFLEKVYPFLKVKQLQAKIVLQEWKPLIREHRGGKALTIQDWNKRLEVKEKLSSLNSSVN